MGGLHLPLGWFASSAWVVCIFRLGGLHLPLGIVRIFRLGGFHFRLGESPSPLNILSADRLLSGHATIGLMIDFMCLPQKPFASAGEKSRFIKSLQNINEWYFHQSSIVLLVTTPPPTGAIYSNTRLHAARGWCRFELMASMAVKSTTMLWDFSSWNGTATAF